MNLNFNVSGVLISCNEKSYVSKRTGEPGAIYNIGIKQDSGIAELNASKEVFEMYVKGDIKDFTPYLFQCQYETNYRNFRVVGVSRVSR